MNLTRAVLIRILSEQAGLTRQSSKEVVAVILGAVRQMAAAGGVDLAAVGVVLVHAGGSLCAQGAMAARAVPALGRRGMSG